VRIRVEFIKFTSNLKTQLQQTYLFVSYKNQFAGWTAVVFLSLQPKLKIVKIKSEVKIGLFSIVVILISIWGYHFLKGNNILSKNDIFYAKYESVEQLPSNAEILLRGKRVGTVTDIFFSDDMRHITIELTVERNLNIPKSARVHIVSTGIASQKAVEINFERACEGDQCARTGDYLIGSRKGLLESMVDKQELQEYLVILREGLGGIIDTLGERFSQQEGTNEFLESFKKLGHTISHLESITAGIDRQLRQSGDGITQIISNTASITERLEKQMENLENSLSNLNLFIEEISGQDLGQKIAGTLDQANDGLQNFTSAMKGLDNTLAKLSEGDGSLAKLLNDPEFAENLELSLRNLNLLLQDIRLNPDRYTHFKVTLFGKGKRNEYELPDSDPGLDR
jgi:phospholipid/cholesterol/gamma-HCH transport system substrate-binding protein